MDGYVTYDESSGSYVSLLSWDLMVLLLEW